MNTSVDSKSDCNLLAAEEAREIKKQSHHPLFFHHQTYLNDFEIIISKLNNNPERYNDEID